VGDKYVLVGLTTGGDSGGSWADAYQDEADIQTALDALTAGDTLHIASKDDDDIALSAALDIDQASGTDGNPINWIGYGYNGGSPIADGTRVNLEADTNALANCLTPDNRDDWSLHNLEFSGASSHGIAPKTANHLYRWIFTNCHIHDNDGDGIGLNGASYFYKARLENCRIYDNGGYGARLSSSALAGCQIFNNGGYGVIGYYLSIADSVIFENTSGGIFDYGNLCVTGTVIDKNTSNGILVAVGPSIVRACRITNNGGYGINISTASVHASRNFIKDNSSGVSNGASLITRVGGSADTNVYTGTIGYIDNADTTANADRNYGLTNAATSRRQEVTL